jgi:hypothetical protein
MTVVVSSRRSSGAAVVRPSWLRAHRGNVLMAAARRTV